MEPFNPIITVTLRQHSPMLHFQYQRRYSQPNDHPSDFPSGHAGACLRPSEVKPKLDKFLIRRIPDFYSGKGEAPIHSKYLPLLVGDGSHPALDYKMSIFAPKGEVPETPDMRDYPIFYGNMGSGSEKVNAVLWKKGITMKLVCFNPAVMKLLTPENLAEFFICTNFGRMTSKGFGSFTVQSVKFGDSESENLGKQNYGRILAKNYGAPAYYTVRCEKNDMRSLFGEIKDLYSKMKSGVNFRGYTKSYLFRYFLEKDIGNEKKAMKANRISPWQDGYPVANPQKRRIVTPPKPIGTNDLKKRYRYVRAMLGVGDQIRYIAGFGERDGRPCAKGHSTVSIKHSPSKEEEPIERFGSPLLFKIIGGQIFLVATPIHPAIFNKEFKFSSVTGASIRLQTPSKEEFDIDDFLIHCVAWDKEQFRDKKARLERWGVAR